MRSKHGNFPNSSFCWSVFPLLARLAKKACFSFKFAQHIEFRTFLPNLSRDRFREGNRNRPSINLINSSLRAGPDVRKISFCREKLKVGPCQFRTFLPIFFFFACESLSGGKTVPLLISAKLETSFSYIFFFVLQIEYFLFCSRVCQVIFSLERKNGNRNRKIKDQALFRILFFLGKYSLRT